MYRAAQHLGLFDDSWVWLVSEEALVAGETPQGNLDNQNSRVWFTTSCDMHQIMDLLSH